MANIKNFGLSGISADVQFGKAGGRVVYDAGNSVFKVTQADGSTLDNIRVATTPAHGNDAASKAYVDSRGAAATTALENEIARAEAAEAAIASDLADEISNRESAVSGVAFDLSSEVTRATNAEAAIASDLVDETDRAMSAEAAIASDLSDEVTRATNAEAAIASDLSDEVSARQTAVSNEATARANADTALGGRIDTEISDRQTAVSNEATARANAVSAEATSRANADTALGGRIDTEISDRQSAVSAEATTRANADTALGGRIDTEISDRQSAVSSEATTRSNADIALGERIDTEISDRQTAVSDEASARIQGDADTLASANSYTDGEISNLNDSLTSYIDMNINAHDNTDEITEGTTNLYFTTARARNSVSVSDLGGDGSLSYNSSTGVISYTGPNDAEIRAHLSAGTGVHYSAGEFSIGQAVETTSNVTFANGTFTGDLSVTGNVSIGGSITVAQSATVSAAFSGNTMTLTGDLTVEGATNLNELVTVTSAATKAAGSSAVNVFQVVASDAAKLFEVRENGDAIIGGTLTVNGSSAALSGNLTTSGDATVSGDLAVGGALTVAGDATFSANIHGANMDLSGNLTVGDNMGTDLLVINAEVDSDIIPHTTGTFDLGSSSKEWDKVYANNVYADLTGNVTGQISDITNHAGYVKGLFSVVDNGGDGALSYADGVITYTGPSAAEVRAHLSAGTGVHYSAGEFSIGQAVETTSDVTFNDVTVNGSLYSNDITATEVVITGNLVVNGTTTTVNTETIALADNVIVLNSNATGSATQNAGIEVERGSDANVSLVWDETANRWTVGAETFVAATFIGDLTGYVTGEVSSLANHTTDDVAEGSTNLYYLDGRVAAYLADSGYTADMQAYADAAVANKNSFVVRSTVGSNGTIGSIVNVAGHTYYVSRITVKVTSAYDATVSISDGTNTLMTAAEIEENKVGTYVAELPFATATAAGASISLVSSATAGAALVTVEYVQL